MKKLYYKLKECENYNVLVLAVLVSLAFCVIGQMINAALAVLVMVSWEIFEFAAFIEFGVKIVLVLLAAILLIRACSSKPAFAIGTAVICIALFAESGGWSIAYLNCAIICICWMLSLRNGRGKLSGVLVRNLTILLFGISFAGYLIVSAGDWITFGFGTLYEETGYMLGNILYNCFNPEVFLLIYLFVRGGRKFKAASVTAVIVIVVALILRLFTGCLYGFLEWGRWSDSLEGGDWAQWETEEVVPDKVE